MDFVRPSFDILHQSPGVDGIYKQIELAGRTCYKSEDKITEGSAESFVDRLIESGHFSALEHGTVYLSVADMWGNLDVVKRYDDNPYSVVRLCYDTSENLITTNYRVLVENGWFNDLRYICEPTKRHEKRVTVKFLCDRGVSHEFVRHRKFSFSQESTRYCNYSKGKFGEGVTFIFPSWLDKENDQDATDTYIDLMAESEYAYLKLLRLGWKPEQARSVLPNSLKTELVMTGFVSDWKHFFDLRSNGATGKPHPQAKELADPLYMKFRELNYID